MITKSGLKNGMMVKLRDGRKMLVIDGIPGDGMMYLVNGKEFNSIDNYAESLKYAGTAGHSNDIVAVFLPAGAYAIRDFISGDFNYWKELPVAVVAITPESKEQILETIGNKWISLRWSVILDNWVLFLADRSIHEEFIVVSKEDGIKRAKAFLGPKSKL